MTPSYWKYHRACQTVHGFSMDVIKKRRGILEEKKVQYPGMEPRGEQELFEDN